MIVAIPRHFLDTLGDENSAMLRQASVLYLRKAIDMRGGDVAHYHHKRLLERLKELHRITKHLKKCNIEVMFEIDFYTKEAFNMQGLSTYLICDLRDFGQPWDEQIEALHSQCEVWRVMSNPVYSEAVDACLRLGEMLNQWRRSLQRVESQDWSKSLTGIS